MIAGNTMYQQQKRHHSTLLAKMHCFDNANHANTNINMSSNTDADAVMHVLFWFNPAETLSCKHLRCSKNSTVTTSQNHHTQTKCPKSQPPSSSKPRKKCGFHEKIHDHLANGIMKTPLVAMEPMQQHSFVAIDRSNYV